MKYIIDGKEVEGIGVNGNCIPISKLPKEQHLEMSRKGGIASNKRKAEKKKEAKIKETIGEILLRILYSPVKPKTMKKKLTALGLDTDSENYYSAMVAQALLNNDDKGNVNDVAKLTELLYKLQNKDDTTNDKNDSIKQLIESIKDV